MLLLVLQLPVALLTLYLDLLAGAAFLPRRRSLPVGPRSRFAIMIPAHDEEILLPRLLAGLRTIDYPSELFDIHVVADNCSDRTAELARSGGAIVHERHDAESHGKGYALRWLLARLQTRPATYDAFVILDADSVVTPNLLTVMNQHLGKGVEAIQTYYGASNQDASWSSAMRFAALALFNHLRPLGRARLGLSAGLRGNGMCFSARILKQFGWESFTLAEDVEFHLRLVDAGVSVAYTDEARVLSDMPTSLRGAQTQNVRWERGRLQMLHAFGPKLIAGGLRSLDPVRLDAVAEQIIPPLSVLAAAAGALAALAAMLGSRAPRALAVLTLAGIAGYVCSGLILVRAPLNVCRALLGSPLFIVWKLWIYLVAALRPRDTRWVRTARVAKHGETSYPSFSRQ